MESINLYGLVIIESLKDKAISLHQGALRYRENIDPDFRLEHIKVNTIAEFEACIYDLAVRIDSLGYFPVLHIDSHGSDDGILLYSGEILSWRAFESLITIINAKLNKQLILCLGLCNGHHFLTRISPFRDVPMNYLVSTEEEISFDELYRGFEAFYESYFSQYRVEQAIEAFNSEIGHDRMCYITAKDYMDMLMTPEIEPEGFRRMVNSAAVLYKASYPEYMDLPFSEVLVIAEYNIRTTFAYYKQLNSIS